MQVSIAYMAVLLIWSTTPLGIVWSSESIPPSLAVMLRMTLAVVLGCLIIFIRKIDLPMHKQALRLYAFSAIGIFGGMSFTYLSAQYIPSGVISLVFGLSPAFSALLTSKILNEPELSMTRKLAILLSFIGLGIVCANNVSFSSDSIYGYVFVLIAVILFSLSGVLVKSITLVIHPMATTVGALVFSLPLFILNWFLLDGSMNISEWELKSLLATVYLGVFGSLIGFFAYFFVLQKLTASTVALITLVTPVIAITLGSIFNNEKIHVQLIIGALLIILGLAVYYWGENFIKKHQEKWLFNKKNIKNP